MDLELVNNKAFNLFLKKKEKRIIKSINIDHKLSGKDTIKSKDPFIKTKAIQLWNIMTEEKQQKYIDKIKHDLDMSHKLLSLY